MIYYAIGDVHGCYEELDILLKHISNHARVHAIEHHKIVFLGDYIDRGPDSKSVMQFITNNRDNNNYIFLAGNHELCLSKILLLEPNIDESPLVRNWLQYGGNNTLQSYKDGYSISEDHSVQYNVAAIKDVIPNSHQNIIIDMCVNNLYYFDSADSILFVHAGILPHKTLADHSAEDLVESRNLQFLYDMEFVSAILCRNIVHGHTISHQPLLRPNRIGIDTGCHRSGRLTAAVMVDGELSEFLTT